MIPVQFSRATGAASHSARHGRCLPAGKAFALALLFGTALAAAPVLAQQTVWLGT